jgi:hypothetical protein
MASVTVPGIHSCGNLHHLSVPGALGPSPCHGGGLRAPFLFGSGVAGMAASARPRAGTSPGFQRPVQRDIPVHPQSGPVRTNVS